MSAKDEAWRNYLNARINWLNVVIDKNKGNILAASEECNTAVEAYAATAVAEADSADPAERTLEALEIALVYGDVTIDWGEPETQLGHSLMVSRHDFDGNTGPFYYHCYFRAGDPIPERDPLTRADALALLAGKEYKHDADA